MTSGPSGKGPSVNRVSSMLVVLGPLPAMDMLPGNAEHRRTKKTKHLSLVVFKKKQTKTKPWEVTDTVKE